MRDDELELITIAEHLALAIRGLARVQANVTNAARLPDTLTVNLLASASHDMAIAEGQIEGATRRLRALTSARGDVDA